MSTTREQREAAYNQASKKLDAARERGALKAEIERLWRALEKEYQAIQDAGEGWV